MKIWTLTINDDSGLPEPAIYHTESAANAAAWVWVAKRWMSWSDDPIPSDWRDAYVALRDTVGFMDSISLAEHDLSGHPALIFARDALAQAEAVIGGLMQGDLNLFSDRGKMTDAYDAVADAAAVLTGRMAEPQEA
jgi:hypothetical protein